MATYVIGDVHGCYNSLMSLLEKVTFGHDDTIWFVGDLVNNGPSSAKVVRWAREHEDQVVCVLGNHDLHLLAVAYQSKKMRQKDTFKDLLEAPDAPQLLEWLRHRPLCHHDADLGTLVHAGLWPAWTLQDALERAQEVERRLRHADRSELTALFGEMYGNEPTQDASSLNSSERLRFTVNVMTRMRALTKNGELEFEYKGTLEEMPDNLHPWFEEATSPCPLFFGHWSAIGYMKQGNIHAMDSGCTWGEQLTAYRIEDRRRFWVPADQDEAS